MSQTSILAKALEAYKSIPYQSIADSPSIRYYTNWSKYDQYEPATQMYPCESDMIDIDKSGYNIVFAGGCIETYNLPKEVDIEIVTREDLISSESKHKRLFSLFSIDESKIYATHVAGFSVGAVIDIAGDIEKPLKILVAGGKNGKHLAQHLLLNLASGSRAKILIEVADSHRAMRTFVTETILEDNSTLELANVVRKSSKSPNFIAGHHKLYDNAELIIGTSAIAGDMLRLQNITQIDGRSSKHSSIGSVIGTQDNSIHYIERSIVIGRESRSTLNVRGIASDSARTVVQGYAIQDEQSFNSGTSVEVSTLTIGKGALAVTIPMLEVRCGDVVEARHAASQAILEQDLLTYLRTRGLTVPEAVKMMVYDYIVEGYQELPAWMHENLIDNLYKELENVDFRSLKI